MNNKYALMGFILDEGKKHHTLSMGVRHNNVFK